MKQRSRRFFVSSQYQSSTCLSEIPPELASAYPQYLAAHRLLPNEPSSAFDPEVFRRHQDRAIVRLALPDTAPTTTLLLRAILILGHCGTQEAFDSLSAFAITGHELRFMALLAMRECTDLMSLNRSRRGAPQCA